ncbi:MAG: FhaA domain-containing protein [Chloroflexota bacterium]
MSQPSHPLERFLSQAARRVSGGSLHPLEVLARVQEAFDAAVRERSAPNDILLALNPADFERYRDGLGVLRSEIEAMLAEADQREGLRVMSRRRIRFEVAAGVPEGAPRVSARFADPRPLAQAPPPGATRRLTRHRNLTLVLSDGNRVAVTHTPFTVGRGPGNDLVLPSLAVSRRHAEVVREAEGYALRDLGSRNGLVVDGQRRDTVALAPGVAVTVGDIQLRLESS